MQARHSIISGLIMGSARYSVRIGRIALDDLAATYDYIADVLKSPSAAQRTYNSVAAAIESLSSFPKRHKLMESEPGKSAGLRVLIVDNYAAFYRVDDETSVVEVVRVLYAKSDLDSRLSQLRG